MDQWILSQKAYRLVLIGFALWLAACSNATSPTSPTDTPQRPAQAEIAYNPSVPENSLELIIESINIQHDSDIQLYIALANDNASGQYILQPANDLGVTPTNVDLSDYPLYIDTTADTATLWLVAIEHRAFPVVQELGNERIAQQLAAAMRDADPFTLATVIKNGDPSLTEWFGTVEVVADLVVRLRAEDNWQQGTNTLNSPADSAQIVYSVRSTADIAQNPTPSTPAPDVTDPPENTTSTGPTLTPVAALSSNPFENPIAGYRKVIDDTFVEANSEVEWFIGSDPTYSASIINRAYQIALTGIDESRGVGLSWGSIQDLVFDDYVIRAEMSMVQDDVVGRLGLWLHYIDDFNFMFFGYETTGRYRVARFQRTYTELTPWTNNPIVSTGSQSNILEVRLQGGNYTFLMNGQALVTSSDNTFTQGRIAFFCYSETVPATCHLERLQVWVPENAFYPRTTQTSVPQ